MRKKILSLLLTVALILSFVPTNGIGTVAATTAQAENTAIISVEETWSNPGGTVTVDVMIEDNPGIQGATLKVSWADGLTPVSDVSGEAFSGLEYFPPSRYVQSGTNFIWYGNEVGNPVDGVILTLTFQVSETAKNNELFDVEVTYVEGDVFDGNDADVTLTIDNGYVRTITYNPGDVTGDGKVNTRDLVRLSQYISDGCLTDPDGYNAEVIEDACDVTGDGRVNTRDLVRLSQYISDGCQTIPEGYNAVLLPAKLPDCSHTMEAIAYKAATCTQAGNVSYYHCATCDKYFNDANGTKELTLESTVLAATGHTPVTDPYVEPTYTSVGWTEGSHCATCSEILVAQQEIPMLEKNEYSIRYVISETDTYLIGLEREGKITNPNPTTYTEGEVIELDNLTGVAGYRFDGWYDGPGSSANRVEVISNKTGNQELFARWEKDTYTITFDSPDVPWPSITYTVDTGATLTNPEWFGYTFVGWSKDGRIVKEIPVGTTGHITLHANWTSDRNKATAKTSLDDPIVIEDMDNGQYLFIYEIGTIENVPLSVIEYIGNSQGVTINNSYSYTISISSSTAQTIAQTVTNATTTTSAWTLSEDWNQSASATNEHEEEKGKTDGYVDSNGETVDGKYYISNVKGGETSSSSSSGGSSSTSAKVTRDVSTGIEGSYTNETGSESSVEVGISSKVSGSAKAGPYEVGAEVSGHLDSTSKESEKETRSIATSRDNSIGVEVDGSDESNWNESSSSSSSWNTTESYEAAKSTSNNTEISNVISEVIADRYGYTSSSSSGGSASDTKSTGESSELSEEYASTVEFSTAEEYVSGKTIERSSDATGYYRLVSAGTMHVFAVVGYDIATNSYYAYTYSILDDETHEYLDYSKNNANFNDCENAILPFEVPYEVFQIVHGIVGKTDGLVIDYDTGEIVEYEGTSEYVVIPEYVSADNGDGTFSAIRVSGISEDAFKNNTSIKGVYLPKYVGAIPDNAFMGCTSLEVVMGYGINKIGNNAFAGCTSLGTFVVDKYVSVLGMNAFANVPEVNVIAVNEAVADAAISSGAKKITLNLSNLEGAYGNKTVSVSDSTEYFALIGNGSTYNNLQVESDATETFISNMNFVGNTDAPLVFSSEKVTLSRVTVENAPGFALILTADQTTLSLYGTVSLSTFGENAVISRNTTLLKANSSVAGKLSLTGNYLVRGDVTNTNMLSFNSGELIYLTEDEYESMLTSSIVTFDANGGAVNVANRVVYYGQAYGALPIPERASYSFNGWYTARTGGEQVTADTIVTALENHTLYAQWTLDEFTLTFDANGGTVSELSRVVSCGEAFGELPVPERTGYTFSGWYTSDGELVTEATTQTIANDITVYAKWTVNSYKVSWDTGTGYSISVRRTSSPNAGVSIGAISNGAVVYYGDVLSVEYVADEGYTLGATGKTAITVAGNVTSAQIYASSTLNSYMVSWNDGTGYSITVNRTSSPKANAAAGILSNGAVVYYGDVLSVTYTANTGYTLGGYGKTTITVTQNVTSSDIYASATVNSYTYNIVYKSSNGTSLGSATATYKYGTTNTITPKSFSGYVTPASQSVVWDSTSAKTITFTYTPAAVSNSTKTGTIASSPAMTYSAVVEYQNRTATSVQLRVKWTTTIKSGSYTVYGQKFNATVGSVSTGEVQVAAFNAWKSSSSSDRSSTGTSGWITVSLNTTNATSVNMSVYYYQTNSNNTDMTKHYGESGVNATWTINIPAY